MKVASDYLQLSAETNNRIRCTHGHINNGYQLTGECKSELQSVNWFLVRKECTEDQCVKGCVVVCKARG